MANKMGFGFSGLIGDQPATQGVLEELLASGVTALIKPSNQHSGPRMAIIRPPHASLSASRKSPSAGVASARSIEIVIFDDAAVEEAIVRAIPHLGWLAEVAPEHISVRRAPLVEQLNAH